jgi:hypothetical protein
MKYRIRCNLWQLEADSASEAKKIACQILKKMPERFICAEEFSVLNQKHGLLRLFLWGR